MQLNDPVTGRLLRMLEGQEDGNGEEVSQYVIQDGLLYFVDDKISSTTTMHSMYSVPMGAKHAPPTRYITSGIKREWSRHSKCVW
ncbi:hypothetical protein Q8A67_007334 [Cirrhinus molitorella]|uniref:Uncharacterized protein n=1 Tax=Cirrhinus molitorella TaxID=172907 RepID=A0AA88PVY1_9TELE|nr:hypothetical protein Q8A67_007334 [Cirrhinus molitorella]